jgi:hypothetical protein
MQKEETRKISYNTVKNNKTLEDFQESEEEEPK